MKPDLQHLEACARAQMSPTPAQTLELIAAVREAQADTEAVKTQMEVAGKLAYQTERENLAEIAALGKKVLGIEAVVEQLAGLQERDLAGIARLERLLSQRDEELAEAREEQAKYNLATLELLSGTMARNPNGCGYRLCNPNAGWFVVCDMCGNKRCPHATNHALTCSGSNAPGQAGSVFE